MNTDTKNSDNLPHTEALHQRLYNQALDKDFDPDKHRQPREAYLRQTIARHFPPDVNANILDLGCGFGDLLICAKQAGYRNLIGSDSSASRVKIAQAQGLQGVKQQDVMQCLASQADNSIDVLTCFDIIEHLNKPDLPAFTDAVFRVLRPGGVWLIHAPNGISPFSGRIRYGDLTHTLALTPNALSQWLELSGYTDVQCFEEAPVVHGITSAIRWGLWQGIRGLLRFMLAVETGERGRKVIVSQNFLTSCHKPV